MRIHKRLLIPAMLAVPLGGWLGVRPSNDRDWTEDNARLPHAELVGDSLVRIHNVRNAFYRSARDFDVRWETRTYDLRKLRTAWYVVEPFSKDWEAPAHTFVSFGFDGGEHVAISVEVRREKGESYSLLGGMLKRFEILYVVADERDAIGLRANHRRDPVYLYPVRATPEGKRAMLMDMLGRANRLTREPEFYNTLWNTCTTNVVRHVNRVAPRKVPLDYRVLLPGYSDRLAYELGLIDTDLPFEEARRRFHVNARAARWADHPQFSARIRDPDPTPAPARR